MRSCYTPVLRSNQKFGYGGVRSHQPGHHPFRISPPSPRPLERIFPCHLDYVLPDRIPIPGGGRSDDGGEESPLDFDVEGVDHVMDIAVHPSVGDDDGTSFAAEGWRWNIRVQSGTLGTVVECAVF
jgi:hypothetical protein